MYQLISRLPFPTRAPGRLAFIVHALILAIPVILSAQDSPPAITRLWEPVPVVVAPGKTPADPPSDAVILFDGTSFDAWSTLEGEPVRWTLQDGIMTVVPHTGDIMTRDSFGDCQIHIEWRSPAVIEGEGQGRGNSGIFLMKRYEVQILDSYHNQTYSNGQAGSIYKQHIPLVNASRQPGAWQSYDIIFTAPRFNMQGMLQSQGKITVFHNGVLVQNNVALIGTTVDVGSPKITPHGDREPIVLQDHNNPVSFRNIWVRQL